jgi:hypothetical protein
MAFRLDPKLPAAAFTSYRVLAPLATHWRPATCAEVSCEHFLHGWRTIVPADSPQAEYIRHDRERSHTEARQPGGLAEFTFGPGQRCFASSTHRIRVERDERFFRLGGDHRGNPLGTRPYEHTRAEHWQEDFAEHQDGLATAFERG